MYCANFHQKITVSGKYKNKKQEKFEINSEQGNVLVNTSNSCGRVRSAKSVWRFELELEYE